jgi:hypothetical protein
MRVELSDAELAIIEEVLRHFVFQLDDAKVNGPPDRQHVMAIVTKLKAARTGKRAAP